MRITIQNGFVVLNWDRKPNKPFFTVMEAVQSMSQNEYVYGYGWWAVYAKVEKIMNEGVQVYV